MAAYGGSEMSMNRTQFCIDAARRTLENNTYCRVLLSECLDQYNDPDNPVTINEVLRTLEKLKEGCVNTL
jgi:hypothetical protein